MIKRYKEIEADKSEIARYLGYRDTKPDEAVSKLILEMTDKLECDFKVCYQPLEVLKNDGEAIDFGCFSAKSRDLAKFIGDNKEAVLFCATIGIEFDRLMKKTIVFSESKAVVLQAVGTAYIEALCDLFCGEFCTKARFSPGYGDLDISVQKEIFKILSPEKNIGVSLTDSMLMTPTKSVTAIMIPNKNGGTDCGNCDKRKNCTFRKVL